ncbi:FadR/GntR family transcriptional regulator [Deinococcus sp. QL22]|uniref:FadR/GntR family transcriptional regulator n=1 Tax=Deinococcus sp. QL22 TaxID=2939437 RepID=UPI0020176C0E|nr:FCD domain-containing protein [Deinococcus sp. QL22]UQN09355.1 FCD domain-containing protein [Deinococcus sp. QL22]
MGQPITAPLGRTVEAFRHLSGVSSDALLDAWQELAVTCARLAAERAQPQDLADLRAIAQQYQDLDFQVVTFDTVARLNLGFVRRIVEAAHNPILSLFVDALIDLIYSAAATHPPGPVQMQELVGVHDGLVRALHTGDTEAAARRMHRHLTALRTQISVLEPEPGVTGEESRLQ